MTVDMQKAIPMPKTPVKDYYFSRKLVVFNETFAEPGKNSKATCFIWHEGEAGRCAFNITSTYMEFARHNRNANSIILYCDHCSSQNKCWILYSAMPRIVNNTQTTTQDITFNYFEAGHSFMSADSVHGSIQGKINTYSTLGDITDYVNVIKEERKRVICELLDHQSMRLFSQENKKIPLYLKNVKVVQYRRGSTSMFVTK